MDDALWVLGFLDIFYPALDSIKRVLNMEQNSESKGNEILRSLQGEVDAPTGSSSRIIDGINIVNGENGGIQRSD